MHMEVRAHIRNQLPPVLSHFSLASRVLEDKNVDKVEEAEKPQTETKDAEQTASRKLAGVFSELHLDPVWDGVGLRFCVGVFDASSFDLPRVGRAICIQGRARYKLRSMRKKSDAHCIHHF